MATAYPEKRENIVYIEALNRTERYQYNKDYLITHTHYDDGTVEEVEYDQWTNRVLERNRNGNVTKRSYQDQGFLLEEELPSGQKWNFQYDERGNLLSKIASTGECSHYQYDENSYLICQTVKAADNIWKQTVYERDRYGRCVRETDSLGRVTEYDYHNEGNHLLKQPSQVTDACGQKFSYEYDLAGRCTSSRTESGTKEIRYNRQNYPSYLQDESGNETRKVYDKMGNLVALFPPNQGAEGKAWIYRYDFFDRMIGGRNPLGFVWKKERNLAGDIICEVTPEGRETRYDYDSDSRKLRTRFADGSVERYFYDGNGNLIKKVRPEYYEASLDDGPGIIYTYDCMNHLTKITGEDGTVQSSFNYDQSGNLIEQTNGNGCKTIHTYDFAGNRTATWEPVEETEEGTFYRATLYEYDTEFNKIVEKHGLEKVTAREYPSRYHELQFSYDALNRLTLVKDGYGAKASYRYDCHNRKVFEGFRISQDVERTVRYVYDGSGHLIEKKEGIEECFLKPLGKKRTVWAVTRYEYDKNGNCIRIVSPKGYEYTRHYDALDRMVKESSQDRDNKIYRKYGYEYDTDGNLLRRVDESLGKKTARTFSYDKKSRLTHLKDECGHTTRLFYDRNDRIVKVVKPQQYQENTDNGTGTSYTYDCRDKVTCVTGADGTILREQSYDLSGNLKSVLEGGTLYTEYEYNLAGNQTAIYTGKEKAKKRQAVQTYTYDAQGNITGIVDGNQNQTEFVLDDWGRITEIHTPEGGVEKYTYDYAGNMTSTTDANGGTITYRYNSFSQVSEIIDQEGNSEYFYCDQEGRRETHIDRNGNVERTLYNMDNCLVYQRAEDAKGKKTVVNQYVYYPDGKLETASGGGIVYHYRYTENGLLKSKSTSGKTLLEYGYDKNRNLAALTDETGKTICYTYDGMDRLERVSAGEDGTALAAYCYSPSGQKKSLHYGNGVQTEYGYGEDGTLTELVTLTPQGEVVLNYQYAYDGNGNCIKKSGDRYQDTYAYDRMNRLTEASYNGRQETYRYDPVGNRLEKESADGNEFYGYNTKNQLLHLEQGGTLTSYRYDRQGNLLEETGKNRKRYDYDSLNRQICLEDSSYNLENHYDGENLRYETKENGTVIRFLYDRNELAAEREGETSIRYIRGDDVVSSERQENSYSYHVRDEMNSTLFLLDQEHEIQKSYRYDAFGNVLEESGEFQNQLTYTGQMYDGAAGQYYLRARYYNPQIGRFQQEDVYRGDGLNLYAYCGNNPVMYYDPSGCWSLCPGGKLEPTNNDFDRIRNYRDIELGDIDPRYLADPEFIVDMPFVGQGKSGANSQGWMRDSNYFYNQLSKTHPELFSADNLKRIANGQIPRVDEQFLKYFPQYDDYLSELIRHHHIGGGGQAMPIPDSLHPGYGGIHNVEKDNGIWGGIDGTNSDILQSIKDHTGRTNLWKNVRIKP